MKLSAQKTVMPKQEKVEATHLLVDAGDKILGRLASSIATSLMGKDRSDYTPHINPKVQVVVINAANIKISGTKAESKTYNHYSGYPGGLKTTSYAELMEKDPTQVVLLAVKRMLPKNGLGKKLFSNLRVYAGSDHPHQAQKLKPAGY